MTEPKFASSFASHPPDHAQRTEAVHPGGSFIVQAPAGSGKTTLLTERFLRLLATVDEPEQVLGITFTRAAVAEMRARVMKGLFAARDGKQPESDDERRLYEAARAALEHAAARGWDLLADPQQLNISTIDRLALQIAKQTPLLSRLGPEFTPTENAGSYYRRAALLTLRSLGDRNSPDQSLRATANAAHALLQHRDNNLVHCVGLIAGMLERRDQWGRHFSLSAGPLDEDVLDSQVRPALERNLQLAVDGHLRSLHQRMLSANVDLDELAELATFAAQTATTGISSCKNISSLPEPSHIHLPQWLGLAALLLTNTGGSRKVLNKNDGFPVGDAFKHHKSAMLAIIQKIGDDEFLVNALHRTRELPPVNFSEEAWRVAKALFRLLHAAVLHLKLIFAESGTVDFTEASLAARAALEADISGIESVPSELAYTLSGRYRHLLVDEFQDTSVTHYEILKLLIEGWEAGDGRSVFLVGDPMQSIYLFRQAEMRLFAQARQNGISSLKLKQLTLAVNFRSQPALIEEHNRIFAPIFSGETEFAFAPSEAFGGTPLTPALEWHFFRKAESGSSPDDKQRPHLQEAMRVRELVEHALANPTHKIAVLVRAKNHAGLVMQELREAGIPYRAIEMEFLGERQEVLDVLALTRALLHPADRAAWLSVFRAPWCGLGLASLEALCNAPDSGKHAHPCLAELVPRNLSQLAPDERLRAEQAGAILQEAWEQRDQFRLPQLVWRTWNRLGGPACVDEEELGNVTAFCSLLDKMDAEGQPWSVHILTDRMERLFAQPNPDPTARVEVLTIHKAKGLGFDVVIVPRLESTVGNDKYQAIDWLEQSIPQQLDPALFLAPIRATGEDASSLTNWIRHGKKERALSELKRLFYVAATRARHKLHLLASVGVKAEAMPALKRPQQDSLLRVAWDNIDQQLIWQQIAEPGSADKVAAVFSGKVVSIRDGQPVSEANQHFVRRLPDGWREAHPQIVGFETLEVLQPDIPSEPELPIAPASILANHETRARGTVLHALLEQSAHRLTKGESFEQLNGWAAGNERQIQNLLLGAGLSSLQARSGAVQVQRLLQSALSSPTGQWILSARPGALTEFPITYWEDGAAYALRLDRVFIAGEDALSSGDTRVWIVDYKSAAYGGMIDASFLAVQAEAYAPKMERYARAWRGMGRQSGLQPNGATLPVRCALYFPAQDKLHIVADLA